MGLILYFISVLVIHTKAIILKKTGHFQRGKYWGKYTISLPLGVSCKNGRDMDGTSGFGVRWNSKTSHASS